MTAVAELYRALVLEHGKRPRNVGGLPHPTHAADGDNPLCGDAMRVEVRCVDDVLTALRFRGESCILATASASLMTEQLTGVAVAAARRAITCMEALAARGTAPPEALRVLAAFADVHRHPVRIGCATLPWRTLASALGD